jgi:hypothetical protein
MVAWNKAELLVSGQGWMFVLKLLPALKAEPAGSLSSVTRFQDVIGSKSAGSPQGLPPNSET